MVDPKEFKEKQRALNHMSEMGYYNPPTEPEDYEPDTGCAWCDARAEEVDELRAKLEAAERRASKVDAAVGVALTAIGAPIGLGLIGLAMVASLFDKEKPDA